MIRYFLEEEMAFQTEKLRYQSILQASVSAVVFKGKCVIVSVTGFPFDVLQAFGWSKIVFVQNKYNSCHTEVNIFRALEVRENNKQGLRFYLELVGCLLRSFPSMQFTLLHK